MVLRIFRPADTSEDARPVAVQANFWCSWGEQIEKQSAQKLTKGKVYMEKLCFPPAFITRLYSANQ